MKLGDVGAHALSNLGRHKLRTALTLCGVGVGVATLTVMVSLGEGVKRLVEAQVDKAELITRITVLPKGATDQLALFRRPGRGQGGEEEKPAGPKINDETIAALMKLPGVVTAYPDTHTPMIGGEVDGMILQAETEGLPSKAINENFTNNLLAGRYWTAAEDDASVVVAPSRVLEDLGIKPADAIGTRVYFTRIDQLDRYELAPELGSPPTTASDGPPLRVRYVRPTDKSFKFVEAEVIGVYESEEFGLAGRRFQAPLALGRRLLVQSGFDRAMGNNTADGEYRALTVKVERRTDVAPVREAIELKGFDTFAIADALKFVAIVFGVIEVLLGFFGGIGLAVSFFGIANTMVMAVLERTREIGVYKALGARDRDVRRVFVAEAAAIGITGGAVGVFFGWGIGFALNMVATYIMRDALGGKDVALFYVPAWLAGVSISLSTIVATVAGLYPAWRAARLDPVVSLRME